MDPVDLFRRLKPILGEREVDRLWQAWVVGDGETRRLLESSLRLELARLAGTSFEQREVLLDPPDEQRATGEIDLGTVFYGKRALHPLGIKRSELLQHAALFGRSGAGKTNVACLLLSELARLGIPFLVFDWKQNYRDLIGLPGFERLVVHTVGRDPAPFCFNPLVPPAGVSPKEWIKKLVEVAQHAYFLGEGVAFVLQEALDHLYREFGVYEGSGSWPTFRDLLAALKARPVKGRQAQWMESALRAIGVLCFGAMNWVLNSGAHVPIGRLLRQQAVLELDAITNSDKTFLIESLLLWIHHYRMNEGGREVLKHVLLIEEAHHVLLKKKQEITGAEAVTDVILREIRELGEGIVLLDQLPSLISKPALENTYTTICMNLKEKGDVTAAAKAMLLESDEARHLGRLPVGWAIVKLQARWVRPFLVRFPSFRLRKGTVSSEQVRARFLDELDVETAAAMMHGAAEHTARQLLQSLGGRLPADLVKFGQGAPGEEPRSMRRPAIAWRCIRRGRSPCAAMRSRGCIGARHLRVGVDRAP